MKLWKSKTPGSHPLRNGFFISLSFFPQKGEGVKKLEFAPLKLIINFLPLDGGGAGWG